MCFKQARQADEADADDPILSGRPTVPRGEEWKEGELVKGFSPIVVDTDKHDILGKRSRSPNSSSNENKKAYTSEMPADISKLVSRLERTIDGLEAENKDLLARVSELEQKLSDMGYV